MAANETQLERLIDVHDQTATVAGSVLVGSVDDFVVPDGVKQKRKSAWGIFREMPFLVKLGTLWLIFLARLIDGITGANVSTVQSVVGDLVCWG